MDIKQLKPKPKSNKKDRKLTSSQAQIWKSKLSWKITAAVFMTILLVQTCIMNFGTMAKFEMDQLNKIKQTAASSIAVLGSSVTDPRAVPFTQKQINRLIATTDIKGLAIYSIEFSPLGTYGRPPSLRGITPNKLRATQRSPNGSIYEFVLTGSDIKRPYIMVVVVDSSKVQGQVSNFINENIIIMLLLSLFVTTVLMIALGRWLLEPILFLRDNLQAASKNPEHPEIPESPFTEGDEIGVSIDIAQKLIKQNAENLKQIKSAAEDKIHKLAYYDTLTGLPNRTLFLHTLKEHTVTKVHDEKVDRFAVVAVDLDHFKDINDSMGHNVGDAILRGVGKRLRTAMPESATVSRTGEDEFAITLPLSEQGTTAKDIAEKVISVVRAEPFKVFNEEFQVRASVGVATFPDDGIEPDQVLKNADIALNRAKEEGRDTVREYSEDFDIAVQQRFQMLRDLRDALETDQLNIFFQPQLDLNTGAVIGAEALLRWWKPDNSKEGGGFISPGVFVPVAEQSGLIVPIGEWVLSSVCKAAVEWRKQFGFDIRVAVNVSAAQFSQSDLVKFVEKTIHETGIDPSKLELEVTESVFMDDIQHTIFTLDNLHALGVEIAIDDFGTGYSSLSYLRQFPIDRLKIDQSFIRNALNNPDDASIARTIIGLGHSLSLSVIAEGVETKDHEKFLMDEGCDEVQGFRYSKPVPEQDFVEFVKNYNGKLGSFD